MRLWSLHPGLLDAKGLVACWREALLAKAVLGGRTTGYKHHPQLIRFRAHPHPLAAINIYLEGLFREAEERGYAFDRSKIRLSGKHARIPVTAGQIRFESDHLLRKLWRRDRAKYRTLLGTRRPRLHPLFQLVNGGIERWERPAQASITSALQGRRNSSTSRGRRRPTTGSR